MSTIGWDAWCFLHECVSMRHPWWKIFTSPSVLAASTYVAISFDITPSLLRTLSDQLDITHGSQIPTYGTMGQRRV